MQRPYNRLHKRGRHIPNKRMVYELYELSEEEIAVVEGARK